MRLFHVESNEQIGAGVAGGAHAVGLGITAVGDGDVARFDTHAIQRFAFVERGDGEIGDPLAGDIVAQMQSKAGFAGSLDARAVDEADPILAHPPARRLVAARQLVFAKRDEPIAAATKPCEQGDVGNIDDPRRRSFRGQPAQRAPAGRIGQDQTQQISRALDVTRAVKRAVPTRQGLDRLGAASRATRAANMSGLVESGEENSCIPRLNRNWVAPSLRPEPSSIRRIGPRARTATQLQIRHDEL